MKSNRLLVRSNLDWYNHGIACPEPSDVFFTVGCGSAISAACHRWCPRTGCISNEWVSPSALDAASFTKSVTRSGFSAEAMDI